jgi:uncharacterized membrane protein YhaH (DUF805 family)
MNWYLYVLKNYATFSGRARRKEFWMFILFHCIFVFIFSFIDGFTKPEYYGINDVYSLAVLIPSTAVYFRRMHDIGKSGWFSLIPVYNLILACKAGTEGDNRYGADPKQDVA